MIKIILINVLIGCALCTIPLQKRVRSPVFGYISKHGIPAAKRLERAENNLKINSRIAGGLPSIHGQQPYQAGLIADITNTSDKSICGGSLVTRNTVLTAAHCWSDGVYQAWKFEVVLGSVRLLTGGTRFNTSAVSVHPQWDPINISDDIAVVHLPDYVEISADISPIALPALSEINENFYDKEATASGFGLTQDGKYFFYYYKSYFFFAECMRSMQLVPTLYMAIVIYISTTGDQILYHASLRVISNRLCAISYPFMIEPTNICTSSLRGSSPCRGDSGGPLVVNSNGRDILIGITSFGSVFGCQLYFPVVYTRVTSYLPFIYQHIPNQEDM